MRIIFKEQPIDYLTYSFPYCVYCIKVEGDNLINIYNKGFLPYTNDVYENNDIFYLARSIKIDLKNYTENKAKRKIYKNASCFFNEKNIKIEFIDIIDFRKIINERIGFYLDFTKKRFKGGQLTKERMNYILNRKYLKGIFRISLSNNIIAEIFIISENKEFIHSWYSFYDTDYSNKFEIGKWSIYKLMEWGEKEKYSSLFLGTCYGIKSIYKLNFCKETKYFDGIGWSNKISELKKRLKDD